MCVCQNWFIIRYSIYIHIYTYNDTSNAISLNIDNLNRYINRNECLNLNFCSCKRHKLENKFILNKFI